ncbi:MAG: aldo/keto reductase [Spirochaetia bacterium]|jgi:aryl-alcohol dehydrogenase-like predicted oxidoreductase
MKKKPLGKSGLELTRVGLGTWAIGGAGWQFGWGAQDDEDSIAAIHRALDIGINWIDTAAVYGLGHSEQIVGRAIAGRRDRVAVATKCGLVWEPGATAPGNRLKAESVRVELEASLRRLKTDYIDLYQIHWPDPDADIEEAWSEIAKAVKQGKVRCAGVSNFSIAQLERIRGIHPVASLQPPYSMLRRDVERELLPYCEANGIGVICYSPLQMGLLTGAFSKERVASLPKDDQRSRNPQFAEPALTHTLQLVEGLRPIAAKSGKSLGELAVAWVLRRSEVTAAIVGARRPEQVEQIAGAGDWELSREDITRINELIAVREAKG